MHTNRPDKNYPTRLGSFKHSARSWYFTTKPQRNTTMHQEISQFDHHEYSLHLSTEDSYAELARVGSNTVIWSFHMMKITYLNAKWHNFTHYYDQEINRQKKKTTVK